MKTIRTTHKIQFRFVFLFVTFVSNSLFVTAQNIGINTTGNAANASALLDVDAGPGNNKGMLIPRVALTITTNNAPIGAGVVTSLLVYNTATINDVTPGYYYWDGTKWVRFNTGGGSGWLLLGNTGTVDGTDFLGTADDKPLNFRVFNQKAGRIETDNALGNVFLGYRAGNASAVNGLNTAIGSTALQNNTSGTGNVAIGLQSLVFNTTGGQNVAVGWNALFSNQTGSDNVAIGTEALDGNTTAGNVAIGRGALRQNFTGSSNTAIGSNALYGNGRASRNIAIGSSALFLQSYGVAVWNSDNVAIGYQSLYSNQPVSTSTGDANVAIGNSALYCNTTGRRNVAIGERALSGSDLTDPTTTPITGNSNVAIGRWTMWQTTSGDYNTGVGRSAINSLSTGFRNTALGQSALSSVQIGDNNTGIGYLANVDWNLTNSTAIGNGASVAVNNKVRIGNTFATIVIEGQVAYTFPSDGRFKYNINEEVKGLEFIHKLRPVNYRFDTEKFD
ncbi:MAG: hypothetical protein EPN85_03540, partial [Bacteroidetes bacterium]